MSDNFYLECPPKRMTDGRSVGTKYESKYVFNGDIIKTNNINNSYEYRNYLQNSAHDSEDLNTKILNLKTEKCTKVPHGEVNIMKEINLDKLFNGNVEKTYNFNNYNYNV